MLELNLKPIGIIRNPTKKRVPGSDGTPEAKIEVYDEFADALDGVEGASHLLIVYWMHLLSPEDRKILQVHPRADRSRPKRGVFLTRSPARPNPMGITQVKLLKREGNVLTVEGLDAMDGSPLLDIKNAGSYVEKKC